MDSVEFELRAKDRLLTSYKDEIDRLKQDIELRKQDEERIRAVLSKKDEALTELHVKNNQMSMDASREIADKELQILNLTSEVSRSKELLKYTAASAGSDALDISELSTTASAAAGMATFGMSITSIYSQYCKVIGELTEERDGRKKLEDYVDHLIAEFKKHAPNIVRLRKENDRIAAECEETTPSGVYIEDILPTVDRCRKYMLFSLITEVTPGVFKDGEIKNCVTVASSRFAFMAGHCLPKNFPKGKMFKVYDSSGNNYDVRLVLVERYEESGDDFAVVEIQDGQFPFFPLTVKSPDQGNPYFILGYDGEYPYADLSYFKGTVRNVQMYASKNYIIGSPGTTSGCSGGGVFSMNGDLYGICVSSRLDSSNNLATFDCHLQTLRRKLGEPSYSHIIPGHYLIARLPNRKRKCEEIDTSGSSDDSMNASKESNE